jgi:glycosyltransferase involved in cell wall biosynthesis
VFNLPSEFILFVGTLEPRKNLAKLVEALNEQSDLPPLVIAGADGWGNISVAASDKVKFLGHVEERYLGGLYAAASVMAYPSLWEGFGLPVLEAMALGTPVISSNCASLPEVIGDGGLVLPLTSEAWAGALELVRSQRSALVQSGLRRAEEFTSAKSAQDLVVAYEKTLAKVRQ